MSATVHLLSDRLKVARNKLVEHCDTGIVLNGEDLIDAVECFNDFIRLARMIEARLDRLEREREMIDIRELVTPQSASVLDTMRQDDGKIIPFRRSAPVEAPSTTL